MIEFFIFLTIMHVQVSQNLRIPNSERGKEGRSGARKILHIHSDKILF
jgi:hypothetical protein